MDSEQYRQTVKLIQKMFPKSAFLFGTAAAFDEKTKMVKAVLEPGGIETGWCKCLRGAYTDTVGTELLIGRVMGDGACQYVILGGLE